MIILCIHFLLIHLYWWTLRLKGSELPSVAYFVFFDEVMPLIYLYLWWTVVIGISMRGVTLYLLVMLSFIGWALLLLGYPLELVCYYEFGRLVNASFWDDILQISCASEIFFSVVAKVLRCIMGDNIRGRLLFIIDEIVGLALFEWCLLQNLLRYGIIICHLAHWLLPWEVGSLCLKRYKP